MTEKQYNALSTVEKRDVIKSVHYSMENPQTFLENHDIFFFDKLPKEIKERISKNAKP